MSRRTWTIAEAKVRLSEILRLASREGPQHIGAQRRYVVVPEALWNRMNARREPMGKWLLENMPRGQEIELPDRRDPPRDVPFAAGDK